MQSIMSAPMTDASETQQGHTETDGVYHTETDGAYHTKTDGAYHTKTDGGCHTETEGACHTETEGAYHTETEGACHTETEGTYKWTQKVQIQMTCKHSTFFGFSRSLASLHAPAQVIK